MELLGKNFYKQNRAIIIAEFRWITIWIAPLMWITLEDTSDRKKLYQSTQVVLASQNDTVVPSVMVLQDTTVTER
ncbi:4795_t:CDS:2 [Rhizophagus irregularis]|nr:4795_t:CDS:2 [Rhizophagus irregularis]